MAEAQITRICERSRRPVRAAGRQRHPPLRRDPAGENIVLVVTASPHRQAAFDGANFIMDFLKTSAPFWKKEHAG